MKRFACSLFWLLLLASSLSAQSLPGMWSRPPVPPTDDPAAVQPAPPLLLANGNLIDVETGRVREGVSLLIEDGLIRKIGKNLTPPAGATVLDVRGKWLLPGLVDSHIHLFQSGGLYTRPDGIDLTKYRPYETERQWLRDNMGDLLRRYLACGVTTVVDVGGPLYQFPYRDRFNRFPTSPRILLTGPLISTYQPPAFKNLDDSPILKATTPDEAREQVRRQLPFKPDFIKIWFIVRGVGAGAQAQEMVKAAIDESHKNGLKVAIHTQELLAAKLGVKFGADYLVHSPEDGLVDDELLDLMKARNVSYCPTLVVAGGIAGFFGERAPTPYEFARANPYVLGTLFDLRHLPEPKLIKGFGDYLNGPFFQKQAARADSIRLANLRRVWKAGVNVVTGTDAGNPGIFHGTSYLDELLKMQKGGLSNADILRASTLNPARIFGQENRVGSLAEGKEANVLVLPQNPLADLTALTRVETVVNRGYALTPAQLLPDSPADLAQRQLNAYNARDLEAFLEPYADDVEIYNFPNELRSKGKDAMRKNYAFFATTPALHCELVNRIVVNNTVIDHERVTRQPNQPPVQAVAIYKIQNGKIRKVYFTR